jgi:hypothetical protein
MRIIAFITDGPTVRDILVHLGEPTAPPRIAPARGPPLWDLPDAGPGTFDPQPAPEYECDQRIHLVTPSVDRQPSAPPGRRMPAVAGHATRAR